MFACKKRVINICTAELIKLILRRTECSYQQKTVLKAAIEDIFSPADGQVIVDFTFGCGGHTRSLLNHAKHTKVFALDRDPEAYRLACDLREEIQGADVVPLLGRFSNLPTLLTEQGVLPGSIDGAIIETGPSALQLHDPQRGFCHDVEGLLDMRMDASRVANLPTAANVINSLDSTPLSQIFAKYGEEKNAKKIASALLDARYIKRPVETTTQLAQLVHKVIGCEVRTDAEQRERPACYKVFDSLRMFVNNELNELNYALQVAHRYLKPGGKLVTITYSSIEDRIVKKHLMELQMRDPRTDEINPRFINTSKWFTTDELCQMMPRKWKILHKKVKAKVEETSLNPRSSFATLTAVSKVDPTKSQKDERVFATLKF